MGYDFDRQKPMDQFIVAFYCKALALAIEVDGSVHDTPEAQLRDKEKANAFGIVRCSLSTIFR